jgi:hypothetical protein
VSRPLANDSSPAWDPKGERLFFVGLRGFEPRLARDYEWDFQIDRARDDPNIAQEVLHKERPRSDSGTQQACTTYSNLATYNHRATTASSVDIITQSLPNSVPRARFGTSTVSMHSHDVPGSYATGIRCAHGR